MIALFYLFKHRREKAEAKLVAQQPVKEKKLNYNQIEKYSANRRKPKDLPKKRQKKIRIKSKGEKVFYGKKFYRKND